jgi:hypothetical protein
VSLCRAVRGRVTLIRQVARSGRLPITPTGRIAHGVAPWQSAFGGRVTVPRCPAWPCLVVLLALRRARPMHVTRASSAFTFLQPCSPAPLHSPPAQDGKRWSICMGALLRVVGLTVPTGPDVSFRPFRPVIRGTRLSPHIAIANRTPDASLNRESPRARGSSPCIASDRLATMRDNRTHRRQAHPFRGDGTWRLHVTAHAVCLGLRAARRPEHPAYGRAALLQAGCC